MTGKTIYIILLLPLILKSVLPLYSVSLNYPFLISNESAISFMQRDYKGNIFIQLLNGTVTKYDQNLTSPQVIPYTQTINQLYNWGFYPYLVMQNGTSLFLNGTYQAIVHNNSKSISFHDFTTYAVLSNYNLNDIIIDNFGWPINYLSTPTPHNIVICKKSIKIIYESQIYSVYDFGTIFGSNVTAVSEASAYGYYYSCATAAGYINITYKFYISNSINQTYQFYLTINFLLNQTTYIFGLASFNANYTLLFTTNETITKMVANKWANIIIMQSSPSQNYYFILPATNSLGVGSANLSTFVMKQIFNDNLNLYILTTIGLIQVNIPTNSSSSLILMTVISLLPQNNNYKIVTGIANLLYITSGPNVYLVGTCIGQNSLINSQCTPYNCSVSNCSYCPLNPQICGTCNNKHARNSSFQCNYDNSTYMTNSNFISNFENLIIFLKQFLNVFLQSMSTVISVPGARAVITPIFYLFGNFDSLFLYQYHDRKYNSVVNDFFSQLNNLETEKWNLVNTTEVISKVVNVECFYNFTNFQQSYQQFNYTSNILNSGQSQGLFCNSQSYLIGVLPIIFGYFCIFHLLFRFSFNWPISKFLRSYQFWLFLLLNQFDGNVQQMTFYLSREWLSIFTFAFLQKLLKLSIIYFGFVIVFAVCSIYFIFRWLYNSKIRIVLENCKSTIFSLFYVTYEFGLRNIYFGAINFFGRYLFSYKALSLILLTSQAMAIMVLIYCIKIKCFKCITKIWLTIILSLLRVLFLLSLFFDYGNDNIQIEMCQFLLILLMIAIFCIGIIVGFAMFFKQYIKFFYKNCCKSSINHKKQRQNIENLQILDKRIYKNQRIKESIKNFSIQYYQQKKNNNLIKIKKDKANVNNIKLTYDYKPQLEINNEKKKQQNNYNLAQNNEKRMIIIHNRKREI